MKNEQFESLLDKQSQLIIALRDQCTSMADQMTTIRRDNRFVKTVFLLTLIDDRSCSILIHTHNFSKEIKRLKNANDALNERIERLMM